MALSMQRGPLFLAEAGGPNLPAGAGAGRRCEGSMLCGWEEGYIVARCLDLGCVIPLHLWLLEARCGSLQLLFHSLLILFADCKLLRVVAAR